MKGGRRGASLARVTESESERKLEWLRRPRRLFRTQKAKLGRFAKARTMAAHLKKRVYEEFSKVVVQVTDEAPEEGRRPRGRRECVETILRGWTGAGLGWAAMPACLAVFTRHAEPGLSKQAARGTVQALRVPRKRAGSHVTLDPC